MLNDDLYEPVANRFRALGEPARLLILNTLREGEATVGELVAKTRLNQGNLSKHLQLLYALGFVTRRKDGLFVHYRLADEDVLQLCEIMCRRVAPPERHRRVPPGTSRPARPRSRAGSSLPGLDR